MADSLCFYLCGRGGGRVDSLGHLLGSSFSIGQLTGCALTFILLFLAPCYVSAGVANAS